MSDLLSEINYDELINNHLLGVVRDALKIAELQGLPGENHFYITFRTNFSGVEIPNMLKVQYPENMTIVLQHQFSDLHVDDEKFSVVLTFGGVPSRLIIPFASISYFADPYARFALSFSAPLNNNSSAVKSENKKVSGGTADVVSIDSFRKK